jgi:hypothetical protein
MEVKNLFVPLIFAYFSVIAYLFSALAGILMIIRGFPVVEKITESYNPIQFWVLMVGGVNMACALIRNDISSILAGMLIAAVCIQCAMRHTHFIGENQ